METRSDVSTGELLGGTDVFGREAGPFGWIQLVRDGLPFACATALADQRGFSLS